MSLRKVTRIAQLSYEEQRLHFTIHQTYNLSLVETIDVSRFISNLIKNFLYCLRGLQMTQMRCQKDTAFEIISLNVKEFIVRKITAYYSQIVNYVVWERHFAYILPLMLSVIQSNKQICDENCQFHFCLFDFKIFLMHLYLFQKASPKTSIYPIFCNNIFFFRNILNNNIEKKICISLTRSLPLR